MWKSHPNPTLTLTPATQSSSKPLPQNLTFTITLWSLLQEAATGRVANSPVTGAGDQHAEQVVDDEGEDDGSDGTAGNGVAGILQFTWETREGSLCVHVNGTCMCACTQTPTWHVGAGHDPSAAVEHDGENGGEAHHRPSSVIHSVVSCGSR